MKTGNFKFMIFVFVIGFLFSMCSGKKSATKIMDVDVGSVTKGAIEQNVLFTGNIEGKDSGDVYPKASGVVSKKLVEEGAAVKAGQPLALVDRDEVGYKFKEMPVDSPIDGVVGRFYVEVGSYVRDRNAGGDTPVALVYKPSVMSVKLDVPERYLERIPLGSIVSMGVDSLVGESFSGSITSMSSVDEKTRTSKVEIDMPNPGGKLKHGMFGKLYLTMERHEDVLIAPLDSISWEGAKRFVFKVENGAVKRIEVETGLRSDKTVEILEGLGERDVVVVGNLLNMKDGEKVSVRTK